MQGILKWRLSAVVGFALIGQTAANGMTVAVSASVSSPAPVATPVIFTAVVSGEPTNNNWYRFSVRQGSGPYHIIRDYGPVSTLMWTASDYDGTYEMEVAASNLDTGDMASGSATFEFDPIATGEPVISPTANSLIFLYSAPPCAAGRRIRLPRIASLLIKPASALCNLDCDYCFYLDREADPYEASRARVMTQETPSAWWMATSPILFRIRPSLFRAVSRPLGLTQK